MNRVAVSVVATIAAGLVLSGCGDDSTAGIGGSVIVVMGDAGTGQGDAGAVTDLGGQGDASGSSMVDMSVQGADMAIADAAMPDAAIAPDVCETMELSRRDFDPGGVGPATYQFGELAGDFTATTLAGTWNLQAEWTGCDSYIFLTHFPDLRGSPSGPWIGDTLWATQLQALAQTSPKNVHYFFVSYDQDGAARTTRMEAQKARFEETLQAWVGEEAEREHWRGRVHFVTDRVTEIEGSVGRYFRDYMNYLFDPMSVVDLGDRGRAQPPLPFAFGIDRHQRWDSVGSLSPVVGRDPEWSMATYAGHFYNHIASLAKRHANEEGVTVVPMIHEDVTDRHLIRPVMLPDAASMAGFDTLTLDLEVHCPHRNVYGCSEWDRIGRVMFCLDPECTEQREIARWITPYWRRGTRRWMIDASPFVGLMAAGGEQTLRLVMGPNWERGTVRNVRLDLRLSSSGAGRALGAQKVYDGGGFNAEYNMNHGPVTFAVPPEAARAELVLILSGHGQDGSTNCSEWCDHRHVFEVNGHPIGEIRSEIPIGRLQGCADKAAEGVPPGQFGNWAIGRAYWCPGWPVDAMRFDITDHLTGSDMEQLTYSANLGGGQPGGGNIDLSVYVVWYAADAAE